MKLNLGVGRQAMPGWVNVDLVARPGVDVTWDLNVTPWPWDSEVFEVVKAYDVLEHLDNMVIVMDECWRVLQPGGVLTARVPIAGGPNHYDDPTHKRGFTERSFNYWCPNTQPRDPNPLLYGTGTWELVSVERQHANLVFVLRRLP